MKGIYFLKSGKNIRFYSALLLFFGYFIFCWTYKLAVLPGLHGDEAWFGLRAVETSHSGVTQLTGMTYYTGILQVLVSVLSFSTSYTGIVPLRAAGVFFNLLGLMIISITMISAGYRRALIFFLLFMAQSMLYLSAPRVAWEVNTFTLFFISILVFCAQRILKQGSKFTRLHTGLFLAVNVIGTYNHILFSAISVAMLGGVVLWSLFFRSSAKNPMLLTLIFNLVNLVFTFLMMRYLLGYFVHLIFIPLTAISILIFIELWLIKRIGYLKLVNDLSVKPLFIQGTMALLFVVFTFTHGVSFFELVSNDKVMMNFYSYRTSLYERMVLLGGGTLMSAYFIILLGQDFLKTRTFSLFAFTIVCYLGILPLYTLNCSFRYYLSIIPMMALYLAFRSIQDPKINCQLVISMLFTAATLGMGCYRVYSLGDRPVTPVRFVIGNRQSETSAHFIQKDPIIRTLRSHKTSKIVYFSDRYFLEQPILFYKIISPWESSQGNIGTLDFDYNTGGKGFIFYDPDQLSSSSR